MCDPKDALSIAGGKSQQVRPRVLMLGRRCMCPLCDPTPACAALCALSIEGKHKQVSSQPKQAPLVLRMSFRAVYRSV
jgi:hypothetical protein